MTRALALLCAALALLLPGTAALAQSGARVVERVSWVEEWDPATGEWVRVEDTAESIAPAAAFAPASTTNTTTMTLSRAGGVTITETVIEPAAQPVRFIAPGARMRAGQAGIAAFGPFRVMDETHAALVGATDAASPQAFAAMLAAFPGLKVIEFVDAPGTTHDLANLKLGRAIRAAGLATHVPAGGSARSGAVELFLAGTDRTVDPGALFAVHSWRDERGREPADFAPEAPENRLYLDYYAEMGMSAAQARAFYAMTNSVPHADARWLEGAEMARWIAPEAAREPATRAIDPLLASGLRLALARSGDVLRAPFARLGAGDLSPMLAPVSAFAALRPLMAQDPAPAPAPQLAPQLAPKLAYALTGAGLLDSGAAFP